MKILQNTQKPRVSDNVLLFCQALFRVSYLLHNTKITASYVK